MPELTRTAMILAAGRGERLRPLTDTTPKPLIEVAGKKLIEYHIENLKQAGIRHIVINTAWLHEKIHRQIGDGSAYDVAIRYSDEGQALETAGGIVRALPLLEEESFIVVNGDIWCDYPFSQLNTTEHSSLAHLVLVDNPAHNTQGDFSIDTTSHCLLNSGSPMYTYSGIGLFTHTFFDGLEQGSRPLAPLLRNRLADGVVTAEVYDGNWTDVGTIERLQQLERQLGATN